MKSSFFIALLITVFGAGVYWYQSSSAICPVPLEYRLGNIDPSFNLSREQALVYIEEAEDLWETEVQRDLFSYNEDATFSIEFIFDERQATANSEETQRETLDEQRVESEEVMQAIESLQAEYKNLSAAYRQRVNEYEKRLKDYNTEVNRYNDRGGAPPDIFAKLEEERESLNEEADHLSQTAASLNQMATKINQLGERGNHLVENYNEGVKKYNTSFGFFREFTQGDYQGSKINVYKFSSDSEVVTVLAHEFGHALGIGHVEGETSLMYYLLEDTSESPTLSITDLAAYQSVCGTEETFSQKVRRSIRELLTIFN